VRSVGVIVAGVLAAGVLLGITGWIVVPVVIGFGAAVSVRPPRRTRAQRSADRRLLAEHADLTAACLEAGLPVGRAISAVTGQLAPRAAARADGVFSPLDELRAVGALLEMGAPVAAAWRSVAADEDLSVLAAAAQRSDLGGAALAGAVREHAAALRSALAQEREKSAGRAGVVITGPLTLCFLPAFLCLGLAPVIIGLLGSLGVF